MVSSQAAAVLHIQVTLPQKYQKVKTMNDFLKTERFLSSVRQPLQGNIWCAHLSNTPRSGKSSFDIRAFSWPSILSASPPLPSTRTLSSDGPDGCFALDFSIASMLGTQIIICLYDQLPDYSPETHAHTRTHAYIYRHAPQMSVEH